MALSIGAEVIQTHPSQPQTWRPLTIDEATAEAYREKAAAAGLAGHWFHAVYLINLATADEVLLKRSIGSLLHYMDLAARLGADGVVFHPGSHKGAGFEPMLPTIGAALREVLGRTSSPARLLVENSAGQGGCVGCRFEEVGAILDVAGDDPRLGVCLDTCHSFANGYDLRTAAGVTSTTAWCWCTPTTPRWSSASTATATPTSARASSAPRGSRCCSTIPGCAPCPGCSRCPERVRAPTWPT